MIERPPGMHLTYFGPDPQRPRQRADETDSNYRGRMARLEGNWITRLAFFLASVGLFLLGTDLAMLFAFGRVEGAPKLPLLPGWVPILSLVVVIIGVRVARRLRKPRARSKPFDWPDRRRF